MRNWYQSTEAARLWLLQTMNNALLCEEPFKFITFQCFNMLIDMCNSAIPTIVIFRMTIYEHQCWLRFATDASNESVS